jgi:nucleoside-diphosphate-sugar epimerase
MTPPRTVLVTGAAGFIGGHVVSGLIAAGRPVRAFVRPGSPIAALQAAGASIAFGDLGDVASVNAAVRGVEDVVHCAGLASDWGPREDFRRLNVEGAARVLRAALAHRIRRVALFSTSDVLGIPRQRETVTDDRPPTRTGFAYGDSKVELEELAARFFDRGLATIALRPTWVFGPHDRSFIPEIVSALVRGQMIYIGDRRNLVNLAYIDNVVDAVQLALDHPRAPGRAYLVDDDGGWTWERLLDRLASALRVRPPRITAPFTAAYALAAATEVVCRAVRTRSRPFLTRQAVVYAGTAVKYDASRIRTELGFRPRVSIEDGLERTIAWLQSAGLQRLKVK